MKWPGSPYTTFGIDGLGGMCRVLLPDIFAVSACLVKPGIHYCLHDIQVLLHVHHDALGEQEGLQGLHVAGLHISTLDRFRDTPKKSNCLFSFA